jgi:hypothetical protein
VSALRAASDQIEPHGPATNSTATSTSLVRFGQRVLLVWRTIRLSRTMVLPFGFLLPASLPYCGSRALILVSSKRMEPSISACSAIPGSSRPRSAICWSSRANTFAPVSRPSPGTSSWARGPASPARTAACSAGAGCRGRSIRSIPAWRGPAEWQGAPAARSAITVGGPVPPLAGHARGPSLALDNADGRCTLAR